MTEIDFSHLEIDFSHLEIDLSHLLDGVSVEIGYVETEGNFPRPKIIYTFTPEAWERLKDTPMVHPPAIVEYRILTEVPIEKFMIKDGNDEDQQ